MRARALEESQDSSLLVVRELMAKIRGEVQR